jgi:hypothetical protein
VHHPVTHRSDLSNVLQHGLITARQELHNETHGLPVRGAVTIDLDLFSSGYLVGDGGTALTHPFNDSLCNGGSFFPPV